MAATATMHHFEIALSDVDRGIYETLDLRVAQHPSETMPRLLARTLAYCLSYEDGIGFSKGGLSSSDESPISVRDATGLLRVRIEVGAPSAERLHKASKAAKLIIYTYELAQLRRQTEGQVIHNVESIEVWSIELAFLEALAGKIDRRTKLELTRTESALYVTTSGGATLESRLERVILAS
jgi:uncharacterized protein YaeQ